MTGEGEQMPRVGGEFVHVHVAAEHQHGALIYTDEIVHQQLYVMLPLHSPFIAVWPSRRRLGQSR